MIAPPTEDVVEWGYWSAMQRAGLVPQHIRHPDALDGSKVVTVSCTQTELPASQQRKLVHQWCEILPSLEITTLVFSSRVNQALFDAAMRIRGLRALFVKWGGLTSLESCNGHPSLSSLYIGSAPSLTGLEHLQAIPHLRHLFINDVRASSTLDYLEGMTQLEEFGLSGQSLRLRVPTLQPLAALQRLETLWLVGIKVEAGALQPLHNLTSLRSLRTNRDPVSADVLALRAALPGLQYLHPVWGGPR